MLRAVCMTTWKPTTSFYLILMTILLQQFIYTAFCQEDNVVVVSQSDKSMAETSEDVLIPPMFVLNLDRSKERWAMAEQQMENAGLHVERLAAVDGRALSAEELKVQSTKMALFFQPRGVIGCYLSHRKFWQMVVDQNLEAAIIFEDDVKLIPNFKEVLKSNLKSLGDDYYDVVLLGAIGRVHPSGKDNFGTKFFSIYFGGVRQLKRINEHVFQPIRPAGTHAYMVSNAGARKLLQLCKKAVFHVDLDAWRHSSLVMRMFDPMLAYQTFEASSLTDLADKSNGLQNLRQKLLANEHVQKLQEWAIEPHTQQPWSHVLAEPLIQLGPNGPILTVERHCAVLIWGTLTAAALNSFGYKLWALRITTAMAGFMLAVRSTIFLLMNWTQ